MAAYLRDLEPSDGDVILHWRNLPNVANYMYSDHVISREEHEHWFAALQGDKTRKYWVICKDDRGIGVANCYDINRKDSRCFWAFYIADENVRGQGIGSFVEFHVLSYVFDDLGLNKLCCEVLLSNEAVWRMHQKFGFKQEGVLRQHIFKGGAFHDVVALAMLKNEWVSVRAQHKERLVERGLVRSQS